jgi:hypothetical protein
MAISVAMLVIISSSPVFARPQPKPQVMAIGKAPANASVINVISRQPIEAILASVKLRQTSQPKANLAIVKLRQTNQPKAKKAIARPMAAKSVLRIVNKDRSSGGIESFINVDGVKNRNYHTPAIDRWIINNN